MKKKVNNAGFSLVEVILAMAILAILAIPLLNYFVESMKYNARMSQEQHATLLAQETVEDLKSQDQLIALTTRPDGTSGYQSNYLEGLGYASISSDASGVSYYGAADAVHKDYDVTITVNADTAENQKLLPQIKYREKLEKEYSEKHAGDSKADWGKYFDNYRKEIVEKEDFKLVK